MAHSFWILVGILSFQFKDLRLDLYQYLKTRDKEIDHMIKFYDSIK